VFSVTIRDHMMVAHSLQWAVFAPAKRLRGATDIMDATFRSEAHGADSIVVDIGPATQELDTIVDALSYRNLDDQPDFASLNSTTTTTTTTEKLTRVIADRHAARANAGAFCEAPRGLVGIAVRLHESHVALDTYERTL
jgi:6-pyruvoyl tetrahydropterin synthase